MGVEPRELVKLTAGLVLSAAAVRYLWKKFAASDDADFKLKPGSPKAAGLESPMKGSAQAQAGGEDAGAAEEGVWIYFGSQSGTAEGFSKELEQEASAHELKATVVDMEDFEPEVFVKHKSVILVIATYGEGDPTDNAVEFFKWLKDESQSEDTLSGVQYTVMSLGNRQYVNFNACGRLADAKMEKLGATRIYERGEGDDDQNIEEDFEQWKENGLWAALRKAAGLGEKEDGNEKSGQLSAKDVIAGLPLRAEIHENARKLPVDPLVQVGGSDILGKWYFHAHQAQVVSEYELRQVADPDAGKTTKHLDFDVKSIPSLDWRTADNLEVLPSNPDDVVQWFAERLGVKDQLESSVGFTRAEGVERPVKKPFPTPCTVQDALGLYCDLCAAPSKAALKKLATFIRDDGDRAVLEGLIEDRQTYQWLTGEGVRLSFRELFELFFASAEVDLGTFLQLCPRQKNRPYTIASSSREDRHKIGICVSVVAEELRSLAEILPELANRGFAAPAAETCLERLGAEAAAAPRSFRGVCSSMLCCRTTKGQRLWISARPSTFRLPRKSTTPIIMIGAGTGIAPFRGFVREFRAEGGIRPKTILFFGCTKQSVDFLYKDELQEAVDAQPKILGEIVTAFSREQQEKVYVQHRLRERGQEIAGLINGGAYVYVCGATAMGAAIREELTSALGSADYVNRLLTEGRFVEELW
eukprot:CAMPEP_0115434242 /NCGR_PEP_ID=MMETSP0271-20121206/33041_1 /TAXON_ID=71861 /ORGANISM="Scrippsiella trochoidea, Strain CCMP3099" /LENGTH=698 /DNA_ID=CAMNT_0002859659 /DNA_START=68 /DNA_END=2164 /DNA_ORIENTATION=+